MGSQMISENQIQTWLGNVLKVGIMVSLMLILIGAVFFLIQHGGESFENNIFITTNYDIDILKIWESKEFFSAIGMIELGLLVLVLVQVLRVGLLCYYYTMIHDKWFMLFSFFIMSVILYSLIWQ
jgi:uncharacterized membrane protein